MNFVETPSKASIPLTPLHRDALSSWLESQSGSAKRWVTAVGFQGEPGTTCLVPGDNGAIREALVGISADSGAIWDFANLPTSLPAHEFHVDGELSPEQANHAALGWALGSYRYERFKKRDPKKRAVLAWPSACDRDHVESAAQATMLVRDLISTPASDMGPAELADAARALAEQYGGTLTVTVADALLDQGFPAIHAVGRAAAPERAPRLIDLSWGEASHPRVTLVGKGVCFDSGGLDIKSASNMKLMKKDMGGGAHVLGVAKMIMDAALPLRLRVLVPAVENSISGSALRPLDVVPTRKGTTIEIGHTDAEGRVILADALAEASNDKPELLIDFATLTGAARIALGAELPALYANDDEKAAALLAHGERVSDPLWRMPLFKPYRKLIDGKVAELTNSADTPLGGSITAALFLQEFVESDIPWMHIDVMAWNTRSRPGRPEGGEAMGVRAVYEFIATMFS